MFESLIDTRTDVKPFWRPGVFLFALLLHVVVLNAVLVQNYLKVPPITEPPVQVTFAKFTPPPAPPPAAPKPAAPTPPPKPVEVQPQPQMPTEMVAPEVLPQEVHTEAMPPEPEAPAMEGVPGGVPGGIPGGVPGGDIPTQEGPLQVGGDVSAPVAVQQVPPTYPMAARSARIQGSVKLEAVIHKDGTVGDIRVVQGLPMGCTEAAVAALRQWHFQPGQRNGLPVDVYYTLTVDFRLS